MALTIKAQINSTGIDNLLKKLETLQSPLNATEAREVAINAIDTMKDQIGKGISPIKGEGRFPRYKNPENYPKRKMKQYPDKRVTPVNLHLSGAFLKSLGYRVFKAGKGYAVEIGYQGSLSEKKERGHREGVNGQPSRPTIPKPSIGENFSQSIQDSYLKILLRALNRIVRGR